MRYGRTILENVLDPPEGTFRTPCKLERVRSFVHPETTWQHERWAKLWVTEEQTLLFSDSWPHLVFVLCALHLKRTNWTWRRLVAVTIHLSLSILEDLQSRGIWLSRTIDGAVARTWGSTILESTILESTILESTILEGVGSSPSMDLRGFVWLKDWRHQQFDTTTTCQSELSLWPTSVWGSDEKETMLAAIQVMWFCITRGQSFQSVHGFDLFYLPTWMTEDSRVQDNL